MSEKMNYLPIKRLPYLQRLIEHGFQPSTDIDISEEFSENNYWLVFKINNVDAFFRLMEANSGRKILVNYSPTKDTNIPLVNLVFTNNYNLNLANVYQYFSEWLNACKQQVAAEKEYSRIMNPPVEPTISEFDKPFTMDQKNLFLEGLADFTQQIDDSFDLLDEQKKLLFEVVKEAKMELERSKTKREWLDFFSSRLSGLLDGSIAAVIFSKEARETVYNISVSSFHFIKTFSTDFVYLLDSFNN